MERRGFFKMAAAASLAGAAQSRSAGQNAMETGVSPQVVIERAATGQPGKGKVMALITPHLDDGPGAGCGTVVKLLKEGYTGYFIRMSNDEKDSYDLSLGETVAANERDANEFVKVCGLKQRFDLGYRNHLLDDVAPGEIRSRLVFLFRLLKVDTVITFDPWGHYEENPDHYITGQAVEAACWMSGLHLDFPEHFAAGLKPHYVRERYYFARGPQLVNRVVDIGPTLETKIACLRACRTMVVHTVRDRNLMLAQDSQPVPPYEGDGTAALDGYVRTALEARARAVGQRYGLQYAEEFHYIGPSQWQEQDILPPAMQL
jgi:LmbE family N-acetylglucosaminyl deacetylase